MPEWKGQQPATARRGTHDEGEAVGRAAAINGRAAGMTPGRVGGLGLRLRPYVLPEVAQKLGVGERQAHRLAKPHALGLAWCYHEGRYRERMTYDAEGIDTLARARIGNTCANCGNPAKPGAYSCGTNACASKTWRARVKAYKGRR